MRDRACQPPSQRWLPWRRLISTLAALLILPASAPAQSPPVAAPAVRDQLNAAVAQLPALLTDDIALGDFFSASFLAAISETQIRALTAQLRRSHGQILQISGQELSPGERAALVQVAYADATVHIRLVIDAAGKVAGMRIVNVTTNNDSFANLSADISALPGRTTWGIYRLEAGGQPTLLHGVGTDRDMPVASTFKLTILGALDAEVTAGRMRWSDVVTIDRRSAPFSQINDWPIGSPITLHTLASLMISRSDNSATDILLHYIGRDRVEAFARRHGGLSGPNGFPILSTLEATVLKTHGDASVTSRWLEGNESARRSMLRSLAPHWQVDDIQMGRFADGPLSIDVIEWFASADAIARLIGWFDHQASDTARGILAINPGIGEAATSGWSYVGYKGGSEPGVMSMSLLLRGAAGSQEDHYAVTISWMNPDAVLDEARLPLLMARAVALLRRAADDTAAAP